MFRKIVFLIVFRVLSVQSIEPDVRPQLKIIGGNAVRNRSDFPYQVSLRLKGFHFCGGAIIDHTFILTAAHCSFDSDDHLWKTKNLLVVAGDLDLRHRSVNTTMRGVSKIYVHPKYDAKHDVQNDIALWEMSSPFFWNDYIQPIQIANRSIKDNSLCNISGWGVTDYEKNTIVNGLHYAEVPVTPKSYCRKFYPEIDALNVLCAGRRGKDSCQGDSGGALVCNGSLTGIVSYGIKCGVYPGVYTDVYAYRSWITRNIRISSGLKASSNNVILLSILILLIVISM